MKVESSNESSMYDEVLHEDSDEEEEEVDLLNEKAD